MAQYKVSGIATVVVEAESQREALARARIKNPGVIWIQADKVKGAAKSNEAVRSKRELQDIFTR